MQEKVKINDDLRFDQPLDLKAIKNYLSSLLEDGLTEQKLLDPILIKIARRPKLFEELVTPFIGYDSQTFNEFLEKLLSSHYLLENYMSQYVTLIDYQNYLERTLADNWAQSHQNHPNYLKYLVCKRTYDEGLKPAVDTVFYYQNTYVYSHHLGSLRKYNAFFLNPLSPNGWFKDPKPSDENIIIAFSDLYHERQNQTLKRALLGQEELDLQVYRFLKEIQIINYNPSYFLANREYFELNIDAVINGCLLAQKELKNPGEAEKQITTALMRRNNPIYQDILTAFDHLPNLAKLIKFFRPLQKEYFEDGQKKSLKELLTSLKFDTYFDFDLLYTAILGVPINEFSVIIATLNNEQIKIIFEALERGKNQNPRDNTFMEYQESLKNNLSKTLMKKRP